MPILWKFKSIWWQVKGTYIHKNETLWKMRMALNIVCNYLHTIICTYVYYIYFSSVQSLSRVQLFATPWIAARQVSLSITNSWSLLKLMSIESVIPSNHLILCRPLLLLSPIPTSIRVFSNESTLHMRWPKYWSFSFSISPSNEHPGLIFRIDWLDLLAVQGTLKSTYIYIYIYTSMQVGIYYLWFHLHLPQ